MEAFGQVRKDYDAQAGTYADYTLMPYGILETQLMASALGDCTGAHVLDLGGGTGLRARQALEAGAASVDVVDLSPEMVRVGEEETAETLPIRWFTADVSKPLDDENNHNGHLLDAAIRESYDLVMANWVFDHARSIAELEGMWRWVPTYLDSVGG